MTETLPLRVGFVPGVTIRKWTSIWAERRADRPLEVTTVEEHDAVAQLNAGTIDVAFVRLPVERRGLSAIRLYGEVSVVVLPRDHPLAGRDSVTLDEASAIPGLVVYSSGLHGGTAVRNAVELVAAGVGALRLPHSLARLNARKDVVALPIDGAAETEIAIAWREVVGGAGESGVDGLGADIEEFIGIVRGRTAASSRAGTGSGTGAPATTSAAPAPASGSGSGSGARAAGGRSPKPHRVTGNRAQANRRRRGR